MPNPIGWLRRLPAKIQSAAAAWKNIERRFPDAALIGIGFNTVWWAAIEQFIDLLVFWHACTRYGDDRPDHPRALVNKLRYLKEHIERDGTLPKDDRDQVRAIRLKMGELSEKRHDFTHGWLNNIDNPVANWDVTRLTYEGKNLRISWKKYTIEDMSELTDEITQLLGVVSPFVKRLCEPWMQSNMSRFVSSSEEKARP